MSHPVVSDKMRYGLKPIAVESKAHLLTVPCNDIWIGFDCCLFGVIYEEN